MKNLTVLAVAIAAGLMTFAASAEEETAQMAMLAVKPHTVSPKPEAVRKPAAKADEQKGEKSAKAVTRKNAEERYRPFVEKYALENGVPVDLAHAVVTIESNYKAYSVGKAGEIGLMQIKPATAKLMGYDGTTTGLFDPETNIRFGMKYLGKARKLGGGSTCGTILKYNAGHAAKRMNSTSRNYCTKVKRHLATTASAAAPVSPDREYERRT